MSYADYIAHHGIKGMHWGVRRYQNPDGSLTSAGRNRYGVKTGKPSETTFKRQELNKPSDYVKHGAKLAASFVVGNAKRAVDSLEDRTTDIGKKHVDTYLEADMSLYRIQSTDKFENFAFYATYKKDDVNKYAGLFGKNLTSRANAAARQAEREANNGGDSEAAKKAREYADNMKIHQLEIKNKTRLKIPSEDNAARITGDLMQNAKFKQQLKESIEDSASKMRRPSQQMLFKDALEIMKKDSSKLTTQDKATVYKALNLSLTNHNETEQAMQKTFYGALKKNGYSALLDLNDKKYSSYKAKSPVIVFDTKKTNLKSSRVMEEKDINKLYKKYNTRRMLGQIPDQIIGNIKEFGSLRIDNVASNLQSDGYDYYNKIIKGAG